MSVVDVKKEPEDTVTFGQMLESVLTGGAHPGTFMTALVVHLALLDVPVPTPEKVEAEILKAEEAIKARRLARLAESGRGGA